MDVRQAWISNSILRLSVKFAACGFFVPFLVYALGLWGLTGDFLAYHSSALFLFCPPYVLSMAFDHMTASDRLKTLAFVMAPANALIYLLIGLVLAFLLRRVAARQKADDQRQK